MERCGAFLVRDLTEEVGAGAEILRGRAEEKALVDGDVKIHF